MDKQILVIVKRSKGAGVAAVAGQTWKSLEDSNRLLQVQGDSEIEIDKEI